MPANFYSFVDSEIQKALPPECKRISPDKLLGKEPYKIRHAFHTLGIGERSRLVNILVLPMALTLDEYMEAQIIKLRDYILSKNCLLIVINEDTHANSLGNTGVFIEEDLLVDCSEFLWLQCSLEKNHKTSLDSTIFEDLSGVIRSIWLGEIGYIGPKMGLQQVNLELMEDQCWSCKRVMKTVSGIVFPNRQLERWNNGDWLYYNQLLPLSKITGYNAGAIAEYVGGLRKKDATITPVGDRYSKTIRATYVAASCPYCNALRGDFHVGDYRTQFLHSLDSRREGCLEYHSISLRVDQEMIVALQSGYEGCDHTCGMGWERY